ncbi:hypothetical protein [Cellulomonas sp. WB94]|uniref:hypothetical protein n=1 Tax=Cellulomonas sp. WB94 TaxID=2173174 RepID=UPI001304E624|nr:hypothetical protein [Cellulomonas sp. WB94]
MNPQVSDLDWRLHNTRDEIRNPSQRVRTAAAGVTLERSDPVPGTPGHRSIVTAQAVGTEGGTMPSWLLLILVGVVLVILGVATNIGQFLIWIGVIVLVVSLILGLVGRGRARV